MKQLVLIFLSAILFSNLAHARMQLDISQSANSTSATPVNQARQSGKVSEINTDKRKMVIGGMDYAYSPFSTIVIINGKRASISDVRKGTVVQFGSVTQGNNKLKLLTNINVLAF
ncbi:hypothetical protein [Candidatus Nitrotoga sp. M5]|uniref:hypothetical protein n=1 Tax=Candidatus Nitrotoga sp. M5 TaxID=2890409 RepID=UPI001EF2D162|nr:hypothetical protein [Candidatus Nitrotoga sp. M5]CAH1386864.1 conserved exported hypothetical protein [Candidatus Nitrotoga sp. M5]